MTPMMIVNKCIHLLNIGTIFFFQLTPHKKMQWLFTYICECNTFVSNQKKSSLNEWIAHLYVVDSSNNMEIILSLMQKFYFMVIECILFSLIFRKYGTLRFWYFINRNAITKYLNIAIIFPWHEQTSIFS